MDSQKFEEIVEHLCKSKAEEFKLLGYNHISPQDIWQCIDAKYRKTGFPRLHQLVNDIYSLKATDYMNWMTMQAYKGESF
nr:post-transcriptional regulator [Gorillibacterium massiliense]